MFLNFLETNKQTYIQLVYHLWGYSKKEYFTKQIECQNRIFSNFNLSNDSRSESLWFKCNLQATNWLQQVIRDKRIIYYITIIFEPCWWWSTRKSLAYYVFYQEIFAFSETLSKGFALQIMTSSTPPLLNCNIIYRQDSYNSVFGE